MRRRRMHGHVRRKSSCRPSPLKSNHEPKDDLPLFGYDSTDEAGDIPDLKLSTEQKSSSTRVASPNIPNISDPDYVPPSKEELAKSDELIKSGSERLAKESKESFDTLKKRVHTTLSTAGLAIPAADLINAGLYALEGDFKSAGAATLASIPVIGDVVAAGKIASKAGKGALEIAKSGVKAGTKTRSVKTGVEQTLKGAKDIPKDIIKGNFKDAITNIGSFDYWRGTGDDIAKDPLVTGEAKKKKPNIIYIKAPEF